ncbi:transposase [Escherichia coli]|nr:transposase [Escherichia coli]
MFTEEEKIRAIELYFKYGKKLAPVVRELGYPSKRNLRRWIRSWEAGGEVKESIRHKPRYTDEQKQVAVEHYLNHWRLPAKPWVISALMCSLAGLMNFIPTDDLYVVDR